MSWDTAEKVRALATEWNRLQSLQHLPVNQIAPLVQMAGDLGYRVWLELTLYDAKGNIVLGKGVPKP